jgi:hypothetical protein
VGLAVERRKHRAAHQRGAAQARQDRSAEPAHRHAAPIDKAAGAAVDRQRRLVAEIDEVDLAPHSVCATQPAVIQDQRPLHTRSRGFAARRAVDLSRAGPQVGPEHGVVLPSKPSTTGRMKNRQVA